MNKVTITKIKINNLTFNQALERINSLIINREKAYVVTPNVDHIIKLQSDNLFLEIYKSANLVLCDGMPLVWASKLLKTPLPGRIAGSDLLPALCSVAAQKKYKIFLMGGRKGAAVKAKKNLERKYPGLSIVGTYCPPFGFEHNNSINAKILKKLNETKPDILFVGLGAPKQEKWIFKHKNLYNVPISIGVGVTIEFLAGMVERAPLWMQKIGLEWLWRLVNEPQKLWKRYLVDDTKFFYLLYQQFKSMRGKK